MSRRPTLSPRTSIVLWVGVFACAGIQLGLHVWAGLALPDSILLAVLLVAMPALAIAQAPLLAEVEIDRIPAYWSSIISLWLLGTASWLVGTRAGGLDAIGFRVLPLPSLVLWTLGLTAAGLLTIVGFKQVALRLGIRDSRVIRALLPVSAEEKRVFFLLAIAAGVGEEVSYRGYAIPVLIPLVGTVGAVLVTSGVFGLLHLYQGGLGILRTATMGAFLAAGFLAAGSLIPAIAAHVLIDILAGIVLSERLLLPIHESGVEHTSPPPSPDR